MPPSRQIICFHAWEIISLARRIGLNAPLARSRKTPSGMKGHRRAACRHPRAARRRLHVARRRSFSPLGISGEGRRRRSTRSEAHPPPTHCKKCPFSVFCERESAIGSRLRIATPRILPVQKENGTFRFQKKPKNGFCTSAEVQKTGSFLQEFRQIVRNTESRPFLPMRLLKQQSALMRFAHPLLYAHQSGATTPEDKKRPHDAGAFVYMNSRNRWVNA